METIASFMELFVVKVLLILGKFKNLVIIGTFPVQFVLRDKQTLLNINDPV